MELVRRQRYHTGSLMVAYNDVGAMVGVSGSWLRQFIGRAPHISLKYIVGRNIEAYARLCETIELDAKRREDAATQRTRALAKTVVE